MLPPTSGEAITPKQRLYYQNRLAELNKLKAQIEESKKVIPGAGTDLDKKDPTGKTGGTGKLIDLYAKELAALKKKRDALKDVNDEMDRSITYQMKQMDLITQASKAKITGNFMEAAMLRQQSLFEGAKYTRESSVIQLDRLINLVEERKSKADKLGKLSTADKTLISSLRSGNYQSVVPLPQTPTVGFNQGATGFAGSTTTIGDTVYTITMNITGSNPNEIANLVIAKINTISNKNNKVNKVKR